MTTRRRPAHGTSPQIVPQKKPSQTKRVTFVFPDPLYEELNQLAESRGITMTEFVKRSVKLHSMVLDWENEGKSLFIGTSAKNIESQIVPL